LRDDHLQALAHVEQRHSQTEASLTLEIESLRRAFREVNRPDNRPPSRPLVRLPLFSASPWLRSLTTSLPTLFSYSVPDALSRLWVRRFITCEMLSLFLLYFLP
jgi:hypothetical protein